MLATAEHSEYVEQGLSLVGDLSFGDHQRSLLANTLPGLVDFLRECGGHSQGMEIEGVKVPFVKSDNPGAASEPATMEQATTHLVYASELRAIEPDEEPGVYRMLIVKERERKRPKATILKISGAAIMAVVFGGALVHVSKSHKMAYNQRQASSARRQNNNHHLPQPE